jgi:hypothetical protein
MLAGDTLYFNVDNSTAYLEDPFYTGFITIDGNSMIGDVIVRTDPVIRTFDTLPGIGYLIPPGIELSGLVCAIGGAESLAEPVVLPYSAPTGFGPQSPPKFCGSFMSIGELNQNPINYFGHTAARFPYGVTNSLVSDPRTNLNYLAFTIYANATFPVGTPAIQSGRLHLKMKVYPKTF